VLYEHRNFFGISRVMDDPGANYRYLVNGGTLHGMQALDPARAGEPLSYYNSSGPVGQLFESLQGRAAGRRVAAVGLGSGSVACYGSSGEQWTFYEINPAVVHVARDTGYFSFLRTCLPGASFVIGDARLTLGHAPGEFDLIILDAFSSDAIPIHLITREALALYGRKLAPGGMLFFHITNRHLDLAPVLGDLRRTREWWR
jgi:SAM-dependent methyltransferase